MLKLFLVTALAMVIGGTAWADGQGGYIRINGSTSVANSIVAPHQSEIEKAAGVKIAVIQSSSGGGVGDLFAGRADIAMISSDLDEILTKEKRAVDAYKVDKGQLRTFSLGAAKVEFIVNEANPIRKLSGDQIKAIYLGTLTNWKDVGGAAGTITPFAETRHGAMRAMVEHDLLGGKPISDMVAEADEAPMVAKMVARSTLGIGFVISTTPASLRTGTATVDTDAQIKQHLSLVTNGEPQADVKRVIEAISAFRQ